MAHITLQPWMSAEVGLAETKERAMWIKTDADPACYVDLSKLDTVYVNRRSSMNYAIIGRVVDRDIFITTRKNQREAEDYLEEVMKKVMS